MYYSMIFNQWYYMILKKCRCGRWLREVKLWKNLYYLIFIFIILIIWAFWWLWIKHSFVARIELHRKEKKNSDTLTFTHLPNAKHQQNNVNNKKFFICFDTWTTTVSKQNLNNASLMKYCKGISCKKG